MRSIFLTLILASVCAAQSPYHVERGRWAAADAVANVDATQPIPQPSPDDVTPPSPGNETCEKCQGSGFYKPDGRITLPCPACGGDGKLSMNDVMRALAGVPHSNAPQVSREEQLQYTPQTPAEQTRQRAIEEKEKLQVLPQSTDNAAARPIEWITNLDQAKAEAARTGKPCFIFWTGDNCVACVEAERKIFADAQIETIFNREFICAKINATHTDPNIVQQYLGSSRILLPDFYLVMPDWSSQLELPRNTKLVEPFLASLRRGFVWVNERMPGVKKISAIAPPTERSSCGNPNCPCGPNCSCGPDCSCGQGIRRVEAKPATYASECGPDCDCYKAQERAPISPTVGYGAEIKNIQYGYYTGGSAGGAYTGSAGGAYTGSAGGAYRGYYAAPAQVYTGSAGGAYTGGSAGGHGGYATYYAAPQQYYQGGYYQGGGGYPIVGAGVNVLGFNAGAGVGYGGGYGGGRMVCGPNGCFMQ